MSKHTSANRAELDESDTTARVCDGCGLWTVRPWHLTHIGESFEFCPACIGAPARRAAAPPKAPRSAEDAPGSRPLVCRDCGAAMERRTGRSGRQRERCVPCSEAATRRWQRDYYAKMRGKAAPAIPAEGYEPERCRGCGAHLDDGEPGLCPECFAGKGDYRRED